MLSWDERLMIGLKVLERLRPKLRSLTAQPAQATHTGSAEAELSGESPAGSAPDAPVLAENAGWPTLEQLLPQIGPLSPFSVILGVCEDGLPFLLDLTNPAPGALLITGDAGSGKTRLLKAFLASAIYLNTPDQVPYSLITYNPEEYLLLAEADHCQHLHAIGESGIGELIEELATTVEERRHGGSQEPAILLAIDDLASCVETLDDQAFTRLHWLIKHGPRSRIWTIATLSTERAGEIDPRFLTAFRTRLVGRIADQELAGYLSGDSQLETDTLQSGSEFCVPYGEEWLRFWICDPQAVESVENEGLEINNEGG